MLSSIGSLELFGGLAPLVLPALALRLPGNVMRRVRNPSFQHGTPKMPPNVGESSLGFRGGGGSMLI